MLSLPLSAFTIAKRINNLDDGRQSYEDIEQTLTHDPQYPLPDPQTLMTAKAYMAKAAEPLVKRLKKLIKGLMVRYIIKTTQRNERILALQLQKRCSYKAFSMS